MPFPPFIVALLSLRLSLPATSADAAVHWKFNVKSSNMESWRHSSFSCRLSNPFSYNPLYSTSSRNTCSTVYVTYVAGIGCPHNCTCNWIIGNVNWKSILFWGLREPASYIACYRLAEKLLWLTCFFYHFGYVILKQVTFCFSTKEKSFQATNSLEKFTPRFAICKEIFKGFATFQRQKPWDKVWKSKVRRQGVDRDVHRDSLWDTLEFLENFVLVEIIWIITFVSLHWIYLKKFVFAWQRSLSLSYILSFRQGIFLGQWS